MYLSEEGKNKSPKQVISLNKVLQIEETITEIPAAGCGLLRECQRKRLIHINASSAILSDARLEANCCISRVGFNSGAFYVTVCFGIFRRNTTAQFQFFR